MLVEEQIRDLQVQVLRRMGVQKIEQLPPREPYEEPARKRVALGLIIGEIVRANAIKLDRSARRAAAGRGGRVASGSGSRAAPVLAEPRGDGAAGVGGAGRPGARLGSVTGPGRRRPDQFCGSDRLRPA